MVDDQIVVENSDAVVSGEGDAGAAITPGDLIQLSADGDWDPHSVAAGEAAIAFAGLPFSPDKDKGDDYVAGERLRVLYPGRGVVIDAIAGSAIAVGDLVVSDGAGRVQTSAPGTDENGAVIGQAEEAAASADDRVRIRVVR